MFRKLIIISIVLSNAIFGFGDILFWQVDDTTLVDGNSIHQFLVPYPSDDDNWPGVRVKLIYNDGANSRILKIWGTNEDTGLPEEWDGEFGVEPYDNGSGRWGTGWVQSETGYETIQTIQSQLDGIASQYPQDVMEFLFVMELGYNQWSDSEKDYVWTTIAKSHPELYENLRRQYMYERFDIAPPTQGVWTPNLYSVPEPSIGILVLLGASILVLRRKI